MSYLELSVEEIGKKIREISSTFSCSYTEAAKKLKILENKNYRKFIFNLKIQSLKDGASRCNGNNVKYENEIISTLDYADEIPQIIAAGRYSHRFQCWHHYTSERIAMKKWDKISFGLAKKTTTWKEAKDVLSNCPWRDEFYDQKDKNGNRRFYPSFTNTPDTIKTKSNKLAITQMFIFADSIEEFKETNGTPWGSINSDILLNFLNRWIAKCTIKDEVKQPLKLMKVHFPENVEQVEKTIMKKFYK